MRVDLHIHTIYSDGTLTPEQVVDKAFSLKLRAIAITDHDTVEGIEPALNRAKEYLSFEVIPGIEINSFYLDEEVHILGYYIDWKSSILRLTLKALQEERIERTKRIIEKLKDLGIEINLEDISEKASCASIGRPHIAMALVEKKVVSSIEEAFEFYLDKGKPAYVPREKITPYYAVDIVKKSGGISVLAHPGKVKNQSIVKSLINYGIQGIEVYHKDHDEEKVQYYQSIAAKYGLLMTGGSDCHGKPLIMGSQPVPYEYVAQLKQLKKRI
ncbi:Phosphoribosyl 1,2-cyclic phosphate 1,2-diphosphodiesterase [Fervidicola ferrireducens]|uniref:Phosphoribosyl 1,2-cyclic phosphate 1,2-diphosphodiesterase n=1 Tax=Fervidicola ferrireducens TaxID=520764 RepID=A0A140L8L7_9FIRM|nr:PHP domain-containing protein [Fervidicola ferrireducens]KXG76892.1 Phosphoribosyl 1,2-cyclic phosphate 1,2-diphosphodiesterase [Fervidicola ferrireducens]